MPAEGQLKPGLKGQSSKKVETGDLASAFGNPEAHVLATMVVATLLETASLAAIEGCLGEEEICVGSRLDFAHTAPTPPGFTVQAEATLKEVDRRRLLFEVRAWDQVQEVAKGTHERFILDKVKFLAQVKAKAGKLPAKE
jgi:predicted thioesterase